MGAIFEAQVLTEFGKIGTTLRDVETRVHGRIDDLDAKLSDRLSGVEIRLERVAKTAVTVSEDLAKHTATPSKPPPGPRAPFGITVSDVRGFLKILPFLVALGSGVAAAIAGTVPDDTDPRPRPSGTK